MLSILLIMILIIIMTSIMYINKTKEHLLISPAKLYSTNNEEVAICNVKNHSELNSKSSYINIPILMKIKNINPEQRLGIEIVGYKLRIELPKYTHKYTQKELDTNKQTVIKDDMQDYTFLVNKKHNINKIKKPDLTFDINLINDNHKNINVDKDYYHKCTDNTCWYDATVINHVYITPHNLHKISWTNRFGEQETKWIDLYHHNIQVPIQPYIKAVNSFNTGIKINKPDNKNTQGFYYKEIKLEDNCENNFNKNNRLNIPCNENDDCDKYGSYKCLAGYCNSTHMNIDR